MAQHNPAEISLARPEVVIVLAALLVAFGWLSYLGLPRQENPTLRDRHVEIRVYLPGAEPEKVERLVTRPLEEKIAEVDDLEDIFSISGHGIATVLVELHASAPLAERLQAVRSKVQEVRAWLPETASDPEIETEVLRTNTMILALATDRPLPEGRSAPALEMRRLAKQLERELQQWPGVRSVTLQGLPEEEIEVAVDLRRLSQRGLAMSGLAQSLVARGAELPSGELELGGKRRAVRTNGAFDAVPQVGATLLASPGGGSAVRVTDVADVRRRLADPSVIVRHDGAPAITLAVEMLDGRNVVEFGRALRGWIGERSARLPHGYRIGVVADEPTYVAERLDRLFGSLRIGMLLVAAVTLLGMGWRSGSVVSLSIPLSLVVAFGFMGLAGVELHQISIAALVIGIGLVVDEAIVVTDNVQRHIDAGATPRSAAVAGLAEIHLAILAGAATTVAAFIPLFMMQGDIGDFVRSIPLVVSLMLLGSVLVAHFVTPLACVWVYERWPRRAARAGARASDRVGAGYWRILGFALAHPWLMLSGFALAFASSFVAIALFLWPPSFFGSADRHQFLVQVRLAPVAPVAETAEVVARVGRWLSAEPRVESWSGWAGAEAPKFYYNEFPSGRVEHVGMLVVNTVPSLPFARTEELVEALNARFDKRVAGAWIHARTLRQGYGGGSDIQIYLQGDDLAELAQLTRRISTIAREEKGVVDVEDSFGYESVALVARIDEPRADALGISHRDISAALQIALDGTRVTSLQDSDEEIPIVVRLRPEQRRDAQDLASLPIFSPIARQSVPLAQVARLEPGFSARSILRFDRQREGSVAIEVDGRPVMQVTNAIEARVAREIELPEHVSVHYYGERKEANESFLSLARAAVVAVLLIYAILVIRFGSLLQPGLIVLAIPMALIGSVWGLVGTGMPISFTAFLGMIALTGIVVNDSIVLLDYINTLRARGQTLEQAILNGARTRLRPVLMTSLTTIVGLIPLSLAGGDFWGPFGFAMIFGLAASTLLTLLIQPAAYGLLEGWRERRRSALRLVEPAVG